MTTRETYSIYCPCIHCSYASFLQMAKSALSPEEYERRQKQFTAKQRITLQAKIERCEARLAKERAS